MTIDRILLFPACFALCAEALAGQGQSLPLNPAIESPGFFYGIHADDLSHVGTGLIGGGTHIPAGAMPQSARAVHQRMCASLGGQDFTDHVDLRIGSGTLDAAVCLGDVVPLMPAPTLVATPSQVFHALSYPVALPIVHRLESMLPSATVMGLAQTIPYAVIGSVPILGNLIAIVNADFVGVQGTAPVTMQASVGDGEGADAVCGWNLIGTLPAGRNARLSGYALCRAEDRPAAEPTRVRSCLGDDCRAAEGVVRYYD